MTMTIAPSSFQRSALSSKRAARLGANPRGQVVRLDEARISGNFSLLDRAPIAIEAKRGLVVRVHSGLLWITQHADRKNHVVRAGQRFVADRAGPLVVSALETAQVKVCWPCTDGERLSPGLEPIDATV